MTNRPLIVAAIAALMIGFGGASLASAHEMGQGQGMQMHQQMGQDGDDQAPAGRDGDDDWSCPRASMMGRGMMDHDMMGRGMMMGHDKGMGPGKGMMHGAHVGFPALLSADDVKSRFETMIAGNKRLKVSKIEPGGDFSFKVEITTQEGAVVHELLVDRRDGMAWETD